MTIRHQYTFCQAKKTGADDLPTPVESFSNYLSDRCVVVVMPTLDQVRDNESDIQRCFLYAN